MCSVALGLPQTWAASHIQNIPRTVDSLALHATSPSEIETIIRSILSKTSYGHDKISNVILKSFK